MSKVSTDERGRITIPREARERYGDEYRLVELRSGIKLIPIPDDPLEALRSASSEEFKSASTEELREAGLKRGREEAEEHVRCR
ncbi:AbrB/MazE/SpoVT family DNA-binding domain-containing protein [Halorussus ruber]|uniref:AbrB/MazE/SpoVT family DNA-binding domain-containing protein n=1 Tax=Halorussus ruber TaxID=1126238 RepID=UPI00143D1FCD